MQKSNIIIIIIFLLLIVSLIMINIKEPFTFSIDSMDKNHNMQTNFCKQLGYLDKPSEELIMFLNLSDDTITQKELIINQLEQQITSLQSEFNDDVNNIINNRKDKAMQMSKQQDIINKGREALLNLHNPKIILNKANI